MKGHRYRITLTHLATPKGDEGTHPPLSFETVNHDDLFRIIQAMRERGEFDPDTAASFALGLKLFGEVLLHERENPLTAEIRPHFGQFMKKLKARGKPESEAEQG